MGVDLMLGDIPSMDFVATSDVITGEPIPDLASRGNTVEVGDGRDNDYDGYLPPSPNQRGMGQEPASNYQLQIPDNVEINLPDLDQKDLPSNGSAPGFGFGREVDDIKKDLRRAMEGLTNDPAPHRPEGGSLSR